MCLLVSFSLTIQSQLGNWNSLQYIYLTRRCSYLGNTPSHLLATSTCFPSLTIYCQYLWTSHAIFLILLHWGRLKKIKFCQMFKQLALIVYVKEWHSFKDSPCCSSLWNIHKHKTKLHLFRGFYTLELSNKICSQPGVGGGLFHYFILTGGFCCLLP